MASTILLQIDNTKCLNHSFKALLMIKINRGLQTRATWGTFRTVLKAKVPVKPYWYEYGCWIAGKAHQRDISSKSLVQDITWHQPWSPPLSSPTGEQGVNQEGPVPITPSVQFSPFFLQNDSTTTHLTGPKIFLPHMFGMLWLEDSKLLHISFTGPKAYLVWDARACILATEDMDPVFDGEGLMSKTLPQTLQDMWPAPAGR